MPENFLTTFVVPDNAAIDDQNIVTEADMIIGNHAMIARNIKSGFLMVGEGVHIGGEINADDDLRADVWCKFDSNVNVGGDAYIGEFTAVNGKIIVEGDLDIGKEVKLNGGFLSKGWVVVRNPLPVMVFIFLYIRAMIGLGKSSEEIDKALNELFEDDEEIDFENMDENKMSEVLSRGRFFVIPIGTKISSESINVPEDAVIGNNCDISTRIICKRFLGGKNLVFNGFIRSKGETLIGEGSVVKGEINTSGKLIIDKNVKIDGKISAKSVWIHETSFVEGKVSSGSIRFIKGDEFDIKDPENAEKATILSKADSFDLMNTNIKEKQDEETEEEPEEIDLETEEYLEIDSLEKDVEEEIMEIEMEEELVEEEHTREEPSKSNTDKEDEKKSEAEKEPETAEPEKKTLAKKQGSTSKRSQKRRTKKTRENMPIVNVFTGENIEETVADNEETKK
ncbi:MAG: hypothetical protein LBE57_07365 [Methanosarcinales archaeon]|nr:hypothetical protein [Methanosarcinales archaeon]